MSEPLVAIFQKRPNSTWCKLICWWTGGPYFHCAFMFGGVGGATGAEAVDTKGVHRFRIDYLDPEHWDAVPVAATPEQLAKLQAWINTEVGCGYDWFGLLLYYSLGIKRRSDTKWWCSEFLAAGLQEAGIAFKGVDPITVDPNGAYKRLARP